MNLKKLVMAMGTMVFFIASFFSFFVFDKLGGGEISCLLDNSKCNIMMVNFPISFYIIVSLAIMMIAAVYVMLKSQLEG